MNRTFTRRLLLSSLVVAGGAASASACTSADPPLPPETNPVIVETNAPPPISGGTLLVTNGIAVAADSDRDLVWLVDLATKAVTSVTLKAGDEPGRLAVDGAGRVHVALRGAGAIATVDVASGKVVDRTAVCSAPRGLAYDIGANLVHVACAGGELITFSATGGGPLRSLRFADRDLRDVVVQADQSLLVTRLRAAEVLHLNSQGQLLNRQVPPTDPTGELGANFTATVAWRAIPIAAASGSGHPLLAVVHQLSADSPVVISQPGGYGSGDDQMGPCDGSIVQTAITSFDFTGNPANMGGAAPAIIGASVPVDVAFDGSTFTIASVGAESLFFVSTNDVGIGDQGPVSGGCIAGSQVTMPGQPVAVAAAPNGGFVAQIRELASGGQGPALVLATSSGISATIPLPGVTRADTGHFLFHTNASATSNLACVSCHPEGHEDGHVWLFDTLGARRTQTVSGGVLATAPLHWNGDMNDLGDVMHVVFQERMGGTAQGPRHVDAFAQWLNSIPAYPASPSGTAGPDRPRPAALQQQRDRLHQVPQRRALHQQPDGRRRHRPGLPGAQPDRRRRPPPLHARRLRRPRSRTASIPPRRRATAARRTATPRSSPRPTWTISWRTSRRCRDGGAEAPPQTPRLEVCGEGGPRAPVGLSFAVVQRAPQTPPVLLRWGRAEAPQTPPGLELLAVRARPERPLGRGLRSIHQIRAVPCRRPHPPTPFSPARPVPRESVGAERAGPGRRGCLSDLHGVLMRDGTPFSLMRHPHLEVGEEERAASGRRGRGGLEVCVRGSSKKRRCSRWERCQRRGGRRYAGAE